MFRRARFSVKPNVRPSATGRGNSGSSVGSAAAPPDPGAQHGLAPTAYSSVAAVGSPTIQPGAVAGDLQQSGDSTSNNSSDEKTNDERGDGDCSKCTETVLQRRKRISTMPNLAKPRVVSPSTQRVVSSVSKGSQKQIPHSPLFGNSLLQKELPSSEKIHVDISPKSPILPEKKTPVPQIPQFSPFKKSASKEPNSCVTGQRNDEGLQKNTYSPLKERPTQEILIQEEITQSKSSPTKEKTICSDREKIIKTQKLRKMLKEELKKEKEQRKYKCPVIEKPVPEDRSKMIMRDFIYYLPENNPMKSSLVEEKKTEKTSTVTQAKEPEERIVADLDDENEEDEEEDGGGVEDDGPLLVPRVKVAEDGSIILDEESLTVEVLRTKGQCVVEENDPIFERGSTTTYSSFRKSYYTKPWSEKETDMFFLAISMVGTDFSMISQLFPHRARTEIKNKFKREEKANGWRIDKAFKEKRPFDFDFFAKLLEKILENERRKKEKDAKCQRQKERNPNEKKAPKIQKKRKAKVVNGQTNHGQDDFQNAGMSDAEMEVDAGTAEKENEESPSILEQVEGQAVTESIVTKKKRKRKKKDSEYEAENLPEERIIPAEMVEKETSRKKRKSTSSSVEINGTGEVGDELEDPDGATPDETILLVEEDPQCCIQFNEEAGGYSSSTLSSTQDNVFIDAESGELDVPEASSVHHVGQPSNSQMSLNTDKDGFDGTDAAKSKVAELDKLDENQNMLPPSHDDDIMETDRSATEKPTMEGRLQRLTSDVASASEKREPLVSDPSAIKSSPSEPMDGAEKTNVGDKTADITEPITEETSRTNNGMERESPGTQKPLAEKIGRRQRPKPNIVKVSSRKEAPAHGKPDKPEPDGTVEKDDAASVTTEESAEKDSQFLTTESLTCKKSTSQESSKHTVLKPALLTRGRMQRPKPNLERIARRQKEPARNTEAEEEKAAIEAEKPLREPECNSRELLSKDTSEVTTYEADMPHSEALENKAVASAVKESSKYTSESPVKKPLECKSHNPPTTSLSSNNVEDAADFATRDFSLQQEQKDISAETEHSLKSYSPSLKDNIGKVLEREETVRAEEEMIGNKNETETAEKSLVNITSECSKSFNLDEAAKCGILAFSLLLEEPLADAQEAVAKIKTHLSPQNLSGFKSDEPKEVLLSPDIEKKKSVGKQSSQEESKQSAIRPTPLLRGRFQRPKPNIRRAVGRKEMQAVETNEAATAVVGNVKSELKKSEPSRTPPMVTQLKCDSKVLPVESLEKKLADTEKVIQEDSQVPRTSQNISEQFSRRKPISQEDTPCTIKPAQLVRGRFQRARPNLGRASGKKEEPVTEDVSAAVEGEVGKMKIGVIKKDNLNPPSKDEVSVQAPLGNLEKKGSGSSNAPSPKRCIDQKKHSSSEKSQGCELLKDQEETCVSKDDDEGKHWDIPGSDISASQEIRQSKSIKPTQHTRGHLQKPKPNLARAAKKKDAALEGEASAEGKTERATRNDATLHGNKSGKISTVMHPRNLTEAASSSGSLRLKKSTDSIGTGSLTRSKDSGKCDSSELSSGSERQIQKEISKPPSAQERAPETLKGKQLGRTLKQKKNICDSRTVLTLECENVHSEKRKHHQKVKPTVSRGRRLRPALHKKPRKEYGSSKVNLVTLRASSQEEDDVGDDDDFEPDYEVECFSPEEVNKAPVFVPKGLRSPNPIPVQIEETMEELEIYENVADEPCLPHELSVAGQTVIQGDKELYSLQDVITQEEQNKETGISDGSTEAAMTLLAMRDPVFQLNISNQEKIQEFPSKDELNIPDSFPDEHNEEQSIVDCNVACSALSKHELVSSDNMNKAATEDHSNELLGLEEYFQETTNVSWPASSKNELASSHSANEGAPEYHNSPFLEECSQETTRVGSDLSFFKGSKTSRIASCSFPKPKPNLNRGLGLNRNAPQKSLGLSSGVEQTNAIQNEEKVSESAVEEQKVELEQNFKLNKLAKSNSAEKQDLQPGNAGPAIQTNDMERENLVRETWELNAQKLSQEAETCPTESANDPNANSNVQASGPIECLQLSTVEVAQTEASKFSSISATAEMTAVSSGSSREYPDVEEEPTFILTLVEISADLADCSVVPPSLQQTSEELLPAPVFLTPDNIDSVELTSAQSIGSITAVVPDNTRERGGLQVASAKHLADLGSTSRKSLKRCAAAFEGSGDPPEKKKPLSTGENLESFDKETSVKLKCILRKAAGTPTEKLNISKKKISSTSRPVTETAELQMEEREQLQSSLNLGAKLFDEAASTSEKVSRTLYAGKAEPSEKKRNFVHTCKSVQSEQVGSMVVLPKTPLSRSLGFLPLICKNNNTDEEVATKRNEQSLQKTHKVVSENTVECPTLFSRDNSEESQEDNSFPLTISSPSKSENGGFSTIRVFSELSEHEGTSKEQEKEEEPTRISEYFFSDIFMEVDDSE